MDSGTGTGATSSAAATSGTGIGVSPGVPAGPGEADSVETPVEIASDVASTTAVPPSAAVRPTPAAATTAGVPAEGSTGSTSAATIRPRRAPFVLLVAALLGLGLCALLALNTATAASEVRQRRLDAANAGLVDSEQQLSQDIALVQAPQNLARHAEELGLVPADAPAFIKIGADGSVTVLGHPRAVRAPVYGATAAQLAAKAKADKRKAKQAAQKKAAQKKVDEKKAAQKKADEKKAAQKDADKKAAQKKAADKKAADKKAGTANPDKSTAPNSTAHDKKNSDATSEEQGTTTGKKQREPAPGAR